MLRSIDARLSRAKLENVPVQIERRCIEGTQPRLEGYVADFSDKLILVEIIGDHIRLDGCNIFRTKDVTALEVPSPRHEFYEEALRLLGDHRSELPPLRLDNVRYALESVNAASPLVVVYQELIDPEVCKIGRILEFKTRSFALQTIDVHAEFNGDVDILNYSDVTRIDFGGGYENALALVAGVTTPSSSNKRRRKK